MKKADVQAPDGVLIRSWRRQTGLTRDEAAAALGISPRMLAYYENGEHAVPHAIMLAVRWLATRDGTRLAGDGPDRAGWVAAVNNALAYGRGEPVIGRLVREGRRAELANLLHLFRAGPDPGLALTDPALFRALRDAGTKAYLSGVGALRVPAKPDANDTNFVKLSRGRADITPADRP